MRFSSPVCPCCHQKGHVIQAAQIRLHVKTPADINDSGTYFFCDTPACDTIYFTTTTRINGNLLNKEVGIKHSSSEDALLCYCFHQKKKNIHQKTVQRIEKAMQKNGCRCEVTNPAGGCCLSSIRRFLADLPS